MSVGSSIRKRRYELKMTQQELADAMGYKTRSTIAKIESGEIDVSQKKLRKFAEVLHTTVEALIIGYLPVSASVPQLPALQEYRQHKNVAVILAGGKSGRNLQNIPSQFIHVHGKPILIHCMDAYQAHPSVDDIYVVCLKGWESIVRDYAAQYGITKLKGLIGAGASGIGSLKNAVDHIQGLYSPEDLVIVQESTRPMVSQETISKLLQACAEKGSATICHSMREYVQFDISGNGAKYINRNTTIALQSPEAHRLSLLLEVFDRAKQQRHPLTESCCTMLLHNLNYSINFIESPVNNIKIVYEEDLAAFGACIKKMIN